MSSDANSMRRAGSLACRVENRGGASQEATGVGGAARPGWSQEAARKWWSRHFWAGAALLFAAGAMALYRMGESGTSASETAPHSHRSSVRVEPVTLVSEVQALRFPGVVRARREAALSFVVGGRIVERSVDAGEHVEAGALVARLDLKPFKAGASFALADLRGAEANLEQSRRDLDRLARLEKLGVASGQDVERQATRWAVEEAVAARAAERAREARRRLAEATLLAPFSGTVTQVHLRVGEFAEPGAPVATIAGDGELELEVRVPQWVASALREGESVEVHTTSGAVRGGDSSYLRAVLSSVGRAAEGPGRLFPVVARIPPTPKLRPGMAVDLMLRVDAGEQLAVPLAAVVDPGGSRPYVFRVRAGRAERVRVQVRELVGDLVTLAAPLGAADSVVVAGQATLLDGDTVEIR